MGNFDLFFIIFISLVIVMCCILSHYFPCPFGQTKKEGFWDEEKLQPKVWDYVMSLGGAFGLPGYWQLRLPPPPPPPKMLTFEEFMKDEQFHK